MARVLILLPSHSYRASDLLAAARRMDLDCIVGTDRRQALQHATPSTTVALPFDAPGPAISRIRTLHAQVPLDGILGLDDETTFLAAAAARRLGLPHAHPTAVRLLSDKHLFRRLQRHAGLSHPSFLTAPTRIAPETLTSAVSFPCVLKPTFLSASRGVIRADDPGSFVTAFERIRRLLQRPAVRRRGGKAARRILIEQYIPGLEVALEGLVSEATLYPLALYDKPDPLEGPTFAETLYVTPSRLPEPCQEAVLEAVQATLVAAGLRHGPVHAELRIHDGIPTVLEIAPRSIGGLCSRSLRFGQDTALEEWTLRVALGQPVQQIRRESRASGVMMIPVPRRGRLRQVAGVRQASAVECIQEVVISVHVGDELEPLPEGNRYVGFIFARADTPEQVEAALRAAYARIELQFDDAPADRLLRG